MTRSRTMGSSLVLLVILSFTGPARAAWAQGVTTSNVTGLVSDSAAGTPVGGATVVAVHVPSGTQYRAIARASGAYTLPNVRIGGPYRITATFLGFEPRSVEDVFLNLGETRRLDFRLPRGAVRLAGQQITGALDEQRDSGRTGAATFVGGVTHALPFLIPDIGTALKVAYPVVAGELVLIAVVRKRFQQVSMRQSLIQVTMGGVLVALGGVVLGHA